MPDAAKFVDAYDKTTGQKVRVPEHFVDIFPNLRKTPVQKAKDQPVTNESATTATTQKGEK